MPEVSQLKSMWEARSQEATLRNTPAPKKPQIQRTQGDVNLNLDSLSKTKSEPKPSMSQEDESTASPSSPRLQKSTSKDSNSVLDILSPRSSERQKKDGFFFRRQKKKDEKKDKKRKQIAQRKNTRPDGTAGQPPISAISAPYDFVHRSHVDQELNWSGDPETVFELQEKLGEGAFGSVYKGKHRESGSILAIKVLPKKDEAIEKEIDIMKGMRNSSTVSYYGTCKTENNFWAYCVLTDLVLLEYCSLGSLRDIIETRALPFDDENQLKYICLNTLKGLLYLHCSGIVHRDLKGANILLNESGHVKLCDFGISAKLSNNESRRLQTTVGSPLWMAPEVINEENYDAKADIWSLGITLLELAEGVPPYAKYSTLAALRLIPKNDPPKLTDASKWSPEFHDLLGKCLQKDPALRPTAVELLTHPWIATKLTDSSVLKVAIDDYLKTKAELQKEKELQKAKKVEETQDEDTCSESDNNFGTMVFTGDDDSDNFSTMVITSGNSADGDSFSTMVVCDDKSSASNSCDNFGTMVVREESESEEKNSYAAAVARMKASNASTNNDTSPKNDPSLHEISQEVKDLQNELTELKTFVTNELQAQRTFLQEQLAEIWKEFNSKNK